ncbi:MAG: hypothetical protein L3J56_01025 [Bacteroidales bacterium]|nr:hypothetical protein [Bacteroidales bacterium]
MSKKESKKEEISHQKAYRKRKMQEALSLHSTDPNRVLNSFEVAAMLGISEAAVRVKLAKHPKSFKIFGRWGLQYKDVVEIIDHKRKEYNIIDIPEQNKAG